MATRVQTGLRKTRFLAAFRGSGNIAAAARTSRITRQRVYEWLRDDEAFAAAYREAEVESLEGLEQEAWRRAVKGVLHTKPIFHEGKRIAEERIRKYSDVLLIFLLKARAPEKYRERMDWRLSSSGDPGASGGDQITPEERERLRAWLTTARTLIAAGDRDGGDSRPA